MGETGFCLRTFSMLGEPPGGHICYLSEYSFYTTNTFVSKVFFHGIIKSIVVHQQIIICTFK